ncbi:2-hydroxyacylsphingosine 1-beta-galactosyltransferase-like [Diaphorina citri]|uniref:2-hydroxyacylsphingosine 1-beta-galactosyltransferase-like n=1 Tax=Diaphorina citri TaxID=121845 RepID=A0A3Q0IXS9_DIACI|nr:2-hydroxyacylsphingosine 1-beta-galactosyltransferase-like [Diaphorina citri]
MAKSIPSIFYLLLLTSHLQAARILIVLPLPLWSHYMQFHPLWQSLAERGHNVTVYSELFRDRTSSPPFHDKLSGVLLTSHLQAARILIVLPLPLWSHYMQFHPLWQSLAERGHNVTVYSAFPPETPIPNFRHVDLTLPKIKDVFDSYDHFERKAIQASQSNFEQGIYTQNLLFNFGIFISQEVFANRAFQDLLHSNDTYDLVILESFFGQEALAVLGHKFQAPIIAETSYGTPHNCFLFMGNPNLYAYMPDYKFAFPARMDFLQRLQNTAMGLYAHVVGDWWYFPKVDEIMRTFTKPEDNLPYIKTMMNNISATFIYSHPILESERPQVSNLIHVGGMHLKNEKLPKDLEDIMSNAPEGVVYVSFGSIIQPAKMPAELKDTLVRVFSKMRQTVLWRWKGTPIANLPKNIVQKNWVPQQAVLDPSFEFCFSYKLAALKASRRFNDRQNSPLNTAIWWVEYVLRHHGAPHLRSAFDDLSWVEFLLLDVLAFVTVVLLTVLYVLLWIARAVKCRLYFAKKAKSE